jgi:hypothetical protein
MGSNPDSTGEIPQPLEQRLQPSPRLVKLVDSVLFVGALKETREKEERGEIDRVEKQPTDMRDEFIATVEKDFPRWKGFPIGQNILSEGLLKGKVDIGLRLMEMIKREGEREGNPLKLTMLMGLLDGGNLSLVDLRKFEVYFKIIEAKCGVMDPNIVKAYSRDEEKTFQEEDKLEELKSACDLIDKIGRLIGSPLVKAIFEQDLRNRGLPIPPKK